MTILPANMTSVFQGAFSTMQHQTNGEQPSWYHDSKLAPDCEHFYFTHRMFALGNNMNIPWNQTGKIIEK